MGKESVVDSSGAVSTASGVNMSGPMTGVRVVELTTTIAGPAAGATLADWGADVIKVEPPKGDNFRYILGRCRHVPCGASFSARLTCPYPGISTGRGADDDFKASPPFYAINRGKRSVVLDLKTSEGVNAIHKLLATADVFLSNYRQKALEPFGLDADAAANRYPRLVVCTLTGYGRVGPDKDVAGYDVGSCSNPPHGTHHCLMSGFLSTQVHSMLDRVPLPRSLRSIPSTVPEPTLLILHLSRRNCLRGSVTSPHQWRRLRASLLHYTIGTAQEMDRLSTPRSFAQAVG